MIKRLFSVFLFLAIICTLAVGCSKKIASASSSFDGASPEIKTGWDTAVAADKANDYVTAIDGYRALMAHKDKLTADQIDVLNATALALNQRFNTAVMNGDPAAKAASDQMVRELNHH